MIRTIYSLSSNIRNCQKQVAYYVERFVVVRKEEREKNLFYLDNIKEEAE